MFYIVIYDKITRKIYRIIPQTDELVSVGYSDNCTQAIVAEKPIGDTI